MHARAKGNHVRRAVSMLRVTAPGSARGCGLNGMTTAGRQSTLSRTNLGGKRKCNQPPSTAAAHERARGSWQLPQAQTRHRPRGRHVQQVMTRTGKGLFPSAGQAARLLRQRAPSRGRVSRRARRRYDSNVPGRMRPLRGNPGLQRRGEGGKGSIGA